MGHQHPVLDHIRSEMPVPRTIAYCPVESGPLDPEVLLSFDGISACVAFTTFAATELNRAIDAARRLHATVDIPEIQIIPHGVDTQTFLPLDARDASLRGREWAKRHLFEARPDLWNAFVVLNANRNQPRKRMDITLLAFALFAQRKRDVALLFHTEPESRGWNVPALARQLGIAERVVLTMASADAHSASDFHLNLVYNSADVGLNTATAEGWGLVSMEHAATGAAQVMPRHTALAEIWAGAAELVESTVAVVHSAALNREYIVSPEAVAAALERLYANRSYLRDRTPAAHRVALDESVPMGRDFHSMACVVSANVVRNVRLGIGKTNGVARDRFGRARLA